MCRIECVIISLMTISLWADSFVREGTQMNIEDTPGGLILSDGILYKAGPDSTTRSMATLAGGHVAVEAFGGSVTLTAGGTRERNIPATVLSKAAFWVDATTNVVVDANGHVTEWLDVREIGSNGTYSKTRAVAMTTLTNQLPTFVATGAGKHGEMPSISFGRLASGQWMQWTAPDGSKQALTNIRHLFVVHGVFESYGQVIGHDESTLSFMVGNLGLAKSWLFYLNSTYAAPMRGRTFLDRIRVDPSMTVPKDGWQLLESEIDVNGASASNFFNDRSLLQKTPFGKCWAGGDNLCEVIVFTVPLTEDERQQVSNYLWLKWRNDASDLPSAVAGYNGALVRMEIPGGITNQLLQAKGDGWAKSGGGIVQENAVAPETRSGHAAILLEGGMLLPTYLPHAVIPQTNVTLSARDDGDAAVAASANTEGAFVKTGTGTVLVSSIPPSVKDIHVSQGTLRFVPPESETVAPDTPVAYVQNGNFEASVPNWSDNIRHVYEDGETADGWTAGGHYLVQVTTHGQQQVGWNMPAAPQGESFASLQKNFTLSTTVGIPIDGIYSVSFLLVQCKDKGWHQMQLVLDGTNVVAHVIANTDHYRFLRYRLPWLTAGNHTLMFRGLNTTAKYSGIDDIRVEWITSEPEVDAIPNPNFEISGTTTTTTIRDSASTRWNFTNGAGIAMRGSLYCQDPADGDRVLYVAYAGAASTTMTFTEPGRYKLIGHVARVRPNTTDYQQAYGSTAQTYICVDGNVIGTQKMTMESKMQERVLGTFDVTAGNLTPTLTITNINRAITAMMTFDRLRVVKMNDEIVKNGGFEEGDDESNYKTRSAANWETQRTIPSYSKYSHTVPVGYADQPSSFGTAQFEGNYRLRINGNGYARQTVTLQAGSYRFVAHVASRLDNKHGYAIGRNPVDVTLSRNGTVYPVGVLYSWEDRFRRHSIPFTVEEPGEYELAMTGKLSGDRTTFIDGVSIEPVRNASCAGFSKNVRIEVADGAKLALDYIGTNTVERIRLGGRSVSGVIDASRFPQFLSGPGALNCEPKGTLLLVK